MKIWSKISEIPEMEMKIFLIALGIIIVSMPVFEFLIQNVNESANNQEFPFDQEKLAFLDGSALLPISDPGAPEPKVVKKMPVVITSYSRSVWETDDTPFITAANTEVRDGIIANNYLPFGTRIRIPEIYGDKIFVVEDRMHSSKSKYQIDIWFSSYSEAKEFGAQKSYIEILES